MASKSSIKSTTKVATKTKDAKAKSTTKTPKITTKSVKPKAPKSTKAEKSAKSKKPAATLEPTIEQISLRAYEIWLRKGKPMGHDEANWLEAEAELKANV